MKSSKFFVKSNYIKNAKSNWISCECKLLCHQNITFLHIKSINMYKTLDDNVSDAGSNFSGFSTLSRTQEYRTILNGKTSCLNVLCNLFEFKSCEIKTVNFECMKKFAIKLVPPGLLSNKKLYLLPHLEDSLTEWCDLLTGYITKTYNSPVGNSSIDEKSSRNNSLSIKSDKKVPNYNSMTKENDIYISLDENDAYEATNQVEYHMATIQPSEDSAKFNLHGSYLLKLGVDALELMNTATRQLVHTFPYSAIRRFGAKDSMFRLEAGRFCSTGHGKFTFQIKDAEQISEKVKENARFNKLKNSSNTLSEPLRAPSICTVADRHSFIDTQSVCTMGERDLVDGLNNEFSQKEEYQLPIMGDEECLKDVPSQIVVEEPVQSNDAAIDVGQDHGDTSCPDLLGDPETANIITGENQEPPIVTDEMQIRGVVEIEHIPVPRHTHHFEGSSDLGNCKSDTMLCRSFTELPENEPRPTSLFIRPEERNSFRNTLACPPIPSKTSSSHIITDYKVSASTFFKYRQRIRNPVLVVPPESPTESQAMSVAIPMTTNVGDQITPDSPKPSPPPLLPKPKIRSSGVYQDQNGYREFDQMLKDLQLSLR